MQTEISQETAKDALDPMALGVRYLEVELICRDITLRTVAIQKTNTEVLTDQQKAKLKTLDDAMKLAPVISDAQNAKLLAGSSSVGSFSFASVGFLTGIPTSANGCASQFPLLTIPVARLNSASGDGSAAQSAGR